MNELKSLAALVFYRRSIFIIERFKIITKSGSYQELILFLSQKSFTIFGRNVFQLEDNE